MKAIIPFIFCILTQCLTMYAQVDVNKINARLEINNQAELLTVKGFVENLNAITVPISYRLKVLKLNKGNKSNSVQANIQQVEANKTVELSSVSINHSPNDEIYISFLVKSENIVIKEIEQTIPEGINKEKFKTSQSQTNKRHQTRNNSSQADILRKHLEDFQTRKLQKKDSVNKKEYNSYYGEMLNGIVIDETITRMGKEFYDYFYSTYQIMNRETPVLLTMKEVFLQNRSIQRSKVIIQDDDIVIFQAILQPRTAYLEAVSQQANQVVNQYLTMGKQSLNK